MSLKMRLGLMAGSSLVAASIGAVALTGVALAPTAALAANECAPVGVDPSANGAAADSYTCAATPYATGITYSSAGDLTVTKTNTTVTTVTANGVNLTGNGADTVTWDSVAGIVTGGAGTNGPVIDVTSNSGAINIATAGVSGNQAGTTHGIRATSTGGGSITITRGPTGAVVSNVAGSEAAIAAVTNGGNISISAVTGVTTGRLRGIVAQTSGVGTLTLSVNSVSASAIDGVAAIDTIAGTGATKININAGTVNGGAGAAIRSVSGGAVTIQKTTTAFSTVSGRVDFAGVAGGVAWSGVGWNASGNSVFSNAGDTFSGAVSFAAGSMVDFAGGADTLTVTGDFDTLAAGSVLSMGSGADTLNVGKDFTVNGLIDFGSDADVLSVAGRLNLSGVTVDFGSGADTLDLSGNLVASDVSILSGLEALDNAGAIYLGGSTFGDIRTDGNPNDILRMTSGTYTGSDGRVFLDANLGTHGSQIGCATITTADCADFTGASTAGSTAMVVQDVSFSVDGGTLNSIVTLVEGSTGADHFTLDAMSSYYAETPQGAAIRKPVVAYYFQYDEANHRHVLVGAPTDEPFQVGTFATSAQETWRATTGSWLTRQADLRGTPGGLEASRGVWGRISGQSGEREASTSYSAGSVSLDFDLSQKQRIAHLNFGADVIGGAGWVLGATVGFVRSDVEFEATPTEATLTGFSGGLYASYVAGPLFVDGLFNTNILHVKADAPQMGLGADVPMKFDLKSLGGQVEAGWRFGMGSGLFVEPLVGASYVVTLVDDAEVPGGSGLFEFDETKSLRLGGGARVGLDGELMGMVAGYSLTGRYWNDSEGGSSATITTASGSSAVLADAFGGSFSEVVASMNLYSEDGGVSGFVNLGGKLGDDYQAIDGSAGVRVRW